MYLSVDQSQDGTYMLRLDHSTGTIKPPKENYSAKGIHADDAYYYVEGRRWVIYIDGQEGVHTLSQAQTNVTKR